MNFGDLRSMIHRGELPPLFATLPEDQHGYAMRMAGSKITARQERLRLAEWLVYAEEPLSRDAREKIDPALDPLLRWYACDVAGEALRMHGNGDARSLRAIEVAREYAQGKASKEDLRRARKDAFEAAEAAADAAYDDAHAASEAAAWAASEAAADAADAAAHAAYDDAADAAAVADAAYAFAYAYAAAAEADWSTHYRKHKTLLTNWLRTYLMRWIEEGNWWEVSS